MKRHLLAALFTGLAHAGPSLSLTDQAPLGVNSTVASITPTNAESAVGVQFDIVAAPGTINGLSATALPDSPNLRTRTAQIADGRWRVMAYSTNSDPLPADLVWQSALQRGPAAPPEGPLVTVENLTFTTPAGAVIPASPVTRGALDAWKLDFFNSLLGLDPLVSADDADPDGDGLSNLAEFIAATTPTSAETAKAPTPLPPTAAAPLRLAFTVAKDSRSALAVPEISTDLKTWRSEGVILTPTGTEDATSRQLVASPANANAARAFIRVRWARP